jgi:chaperone required for assembly of F1-ATPase
MQETGIKPFTMPLMTLAATAIDQVSRMLLVPQRCYMLLSRGGSAGVGA